MNTEAKRYNSVLKISIILIVGLFVFIFSLGWFYIYGKGLNLATIKVEAEYLSKEAEVLENLQIKYSKISTSSDLVLDSLPKTKNVSSYLADIGGLANKNGLILSSVIIGGGKESKKTTDLDYSQTVKKGGYYELPLKLTFEGSYDSFTNFLAEVNQLRRLTSINDIEIANSSKETGPADAVKVTLNLVIFIKK